MIDAASKTLFVAGMHWEREIPTGHNVHAINPTTARSRLGLAGRRRDGACVGSLDVHAHPQTSAARCRWWAASCTCLRWPRRRLRPVPWPCRGDQRGHPGDDGRLVDGRPGRGHLAAGRDGVGRQRCHRGDRQPDRRWQLHCTRTASRSLASPAWGRRPTSWYPTRWMAMDSSDADFGSVNPVIINVPGRHAFQHRRRDFQGRTVLPAERRDASARPAAPRRAAISPPSGSRRPGCPSTASPRPIGRRPGPTWSSRPPAARRVAQRAPAPGG